MQKLNVTEGYMVFDCPRNINPTTTSGILPCYSCAHMYLIHSTREVVDFVGCDYEIE